MALAKYAVIAAGMFGLYAAIPKLHADRAPTFEVPEQTAIDRLAAKSRLVEGTGFGSLTIKGAGRSGNSLLIGIRRAGAPKTLKCRVEVAAVSETRSSAEVDCAQLGAGTEEPMRAVAADAFEIVVREHVAATIGARPYDIDGVADRLMAFMVTHRAEMAMAMTRSRSEGERVDARRE